MTAHTANALADVDAVVEVDEAGKIMHSRPGDRVVGTEALPHGGEHRAIGPNLRVTVHADLRGWNTGEAGYLYRGMAVAAIDAEPTDVVLVAERHWLLAHHTGLGYVRRAIEGQEKPDE